MSQEAGDGDLVLLVFGAGGALWRDKLLDAVRSLRATLVREGVRLAVWGVELANRIDHTSEDVDAWFAADTAEGRRALAAALEASSVHLAYIASPNETHVEILLTLLDRVPFILVEKPLASEAEAARRAASKAEAASGSVCKGIDHYIAKPAVREVMRLARGGRVIERIGELTDIRFTMLEKGAIDPARASTLDAGLTFDMAIHGFTLLLALLGISDSRSVRIDAAAAARYLDAPIAGETAARIACSVIDGPRAELRIGKGLVEDKRLTLFGTEGVLHVDIAAHRVEFGPLGKDREILFQADRDDAYDVALEEAARGALERVRPPYHADWLIDPSLATAALELVERAREAFGEIESYTIGSMPQALGSLRE